MSLTDERTKSLADRLPAGLLDSIVRHLNPKQIIVFGSQARGTAHAESDWDLLLVLDDETRPEQVNWEVMGKVRLGISGPVDFVTFRESTFRERVDIVGSLPWIAASQGTVVYERSKAA